MNKVLLTGFDPFGGESINPAWEAVRRLDGAQIGHCSVVGRMLPTVFDDSILTLKSYLSEIRPDLTICVGQAGGSPNIRVERVAINVNDARIPDNKGQQPLDTPVAPGGPAAYFSTLPVKAMVKAISQAGVPAVLSYTAGTFVCNHIFYGLMHTLSTEIQRGRGGFIHIPFLPEQTANGHAGQPSMALETIVHGLEVAISAAAMYQHDDISSVGGTLD